MASVSYVVVYKCLGGKKPYGLKGGGNRAEWKDERRLSGCFEDVGIFGSSCLKGKEELMREILKVSLGVLVVFVIGLLAYSKATGINPATVTGALWGIAIVGATVDATHKRSPRQRITTFIAESQYRILCEIARRTGVPISNLIGQALDMFLQNLELVTDPKTPPIDLEFLKKRTADMRSNETKLTNVV